MLMEREVAWEPPAGMLTHADVPIAPELDFFAPPPPEIGEVLNAFSSLKRGRRPLSAAAKGAILFLPGIVTLAALSYTKAVDDIWQVVIFIVLFVIGWFFTRFAHTCTYVGKDGVARIRCKRDRENITQQEVFRFRDATELRTSQTRHYHNGAYTGTGYDFAWTDDQDRRVFRCNGTYRGEKKPPKPTDAFHFAEAAEVAWSIHLLDRAQEQLEQAGAIVFRLGGTDWVAVGPGFLELNLKGERRRCESAEIGGFSINGGTFKLKRTDAQEGWFRSTGVFQFPYATMANARVFLLAIDRLLGHRFS